MVTQGVECGPRAARYEKALRVMRPTFAIASPSPASRCARHDAEGQTLGLRADELAVDNAVDRYLRHLLLSLGGLQNHDVILRAHLQVVGVQTFLELTHLFLGAASACRCDEQGE